MKRLCMAFVLSALAGCATVEMTSVGKLENGERLLVIQNDGYELFWCIPLWTGSLTWDSAKKEVVRTPVLFRNNSNTPRLYEMARRIADRENCELADVTFIDNYKALDLSNCYGSIRQCDSAISVILRPRK